LVTKKENELIKRTMKKPFLLLLVAAVITSSIFGQINILYSTNNGTINFRSDAPFETIKATSKQLKGVLDASKKTFAFKVSMASFEGFNSALQREHFNENYIETNKYPDAAFQGKVIEDIDFSKEGTYTIRAKGNFTVHGVSQERIIKNDVVVQGGKIAIKSAFTVLLNDHNIPIPKVVKDKLSSEINVQINCVLAAR
jgi:hypothetical protein